MDEGNAQGVGDDTAQAVKEAFAKRLRALLDDRGWPQADLARRATAAHAGGRTVASYDVTNYLTGRSLPRQDKLEALAAAFGIDPDTLLPTRGSRPASRRGAGAANLPTGAGEGAASGGGPFARSGVFEMRMEPDGSFLVRIERLVSPAVAGRLMALLSETAEDGDRGPGDPGAVP